MNSILCISLFICMGVFVFFDVNAQKPKRFTFNPNKINYLTKDKLKTEKQRKSLVKDLIAEDTFSVGYSKYLFGGLFGGGYPPIGLTQGYFSPYFHYNPYVFGGGGYFGHHHHQFHHHHEHGHHGGIYSPFSLYGGINF